MFTPMARSSYRWQGYYDQRGAVERVSSRLAGGFGFKRSGGPQAGEDAPASPWRWPWGASGPANLSTCGVWSSAPDRRHSPVTRANSDPTDRTAEPGPP